MLNDLDLMSIHVRALFTHDAELRLLAINEPDAAVAPAPRLFLGRTRAGNVWRFRADLPENLIQELDSLCAGESPLSTDLKEPPRYAERYRQLLAPIEEVSTGPAYCFPKHAPPRRLSNVIPVTDAQTLQGGFEKLVAELPTWQPFVAVVEDNQAVSVCRSVRITPDAHEAGVETLPECRGKGYAVDATVEWAHTVWSTGAIPLYSTSWENKASQAVARKLGLECYGVDFEIS